MRSFGRPRTIRDKRRSLVATDVVGAFALRTSSCYVSFAAAQWALRARNNCWLTRLGLAWAVLEARTVIPIPAILQLRRSSDKSVPQMVMPLWCAVLADRTIRGQATISRRYRCRRRLCPAHQQLLRFVRSCTMGAESQKQLLAHKAWTSLGSMARTVIPIPAILQLRRSSDKSVPQMVMPLWCAVLADRGPSGTSDDLSSLQMSSAPLPCAPAAATFRSQLHNGR